MEQLLTAWKTPEAQALMSKWHRLTRSIKEPYRKFCVSRLLENEMDHLIYLANAGSTTTGDAGYYTKHVFPVVRRVWPFLISNEIVSVQPMNAPVGAVSYFKVKYGTEKGATTKGTEMIANFDMYYSSETISNEAVGTTPAGGGGDLTYSASLDFTPVKKATDAGAAGPIITVVTNETSPRTIRYTDANGSGTLVGDAVGASGSINYTNGAFAMVIPSLTSQKVGVVTAFYEYNSELNTAVPEVDVAVEIAEVRARSRKLKAVWSTESAEDLRALHGIDVESELVAGVSSQIGLEVDREIINDIYTHVDAVVKYNWDRTVPSGISDIDHIRSILTVLSTASNAIHKRTLRSPANWIVTSPDVAALFDQFATHQLFRPAVGSVPETGVPVTPPRRPGIYFAGTLQSKWAVYVDPYFTSTKVLLGLKGDYWMDAGYVYAPYIPIQMTPTFMDPTDFGLKKGLRTRYATKLIYTEYYALVTVLNM